SDETTTVRSSFQVPEPSRTRTLPRATPASALPLASVLNQESIPADPDFFFPVESTQFTSALTPTSTKASATGSCRGPRGTRTVKGVGRATGIAISAGFEVASARILPDQTSPAHSWSTIPSTKP